MKQIRYLLFANYLTIEIKSKNLVIIVAETPDKNLRP